MVTVSSKRNAGRRGNAILEGALVFLPLFALIFAIVDFGFAMFLRSTFQHAVREGCRYAVTSQTMSGMGHDASIGQVVKTNALGFLNSAKVGSGADCKICIKYYDTETGDQVTSNSPGNIVEVSVDGYGWSWMAPIWRSETGVMIRASASDRMEGLGPGMVSPKR